jgi:hypothetical protein
MSVSCAANNQAQREQAAEDSIAQKAQRQPPCDDGEYRALEQTRNERSGAASQADCARRGVEFVAQTAQQIGQNVLHGQRNNSRTTTTSRRSRASTSRLNCVKLSPANLWSRGGRNGKIDAGSNHRA